MTSAIPLLPRTPADEAALLKSRNEIHRAAYQFAHRVSPHKELESLSAEFQGAVGNVLTWDAMQETYREHYLLGTTRGLEACVDLHQALASYHLFLTENEHITRPSADFIAPLEEMIEKIKAVGFFFHQEASGASDAMAGEMDPKTYSRMYNHIEFLSDTLDAQIAGEGLTRPDVAEDNDEYLKLRGESFLAISKAFHQYIVVNLALIRQDIAFYNIVYGNGDTPRLALQENMPVVPRDRFCEKIDILEDVLRDSVLRKQFVDNQLNRIQSKAEPAPESRPALH